MISAPCVDTECGDVPAGIDTEVFSPKFNASNEETRSMLTGGEPHKPLLLHVGRLGAEKNIKLLRDVLERMPHARLAVVGSGPAEEDLREYFKGTPTVFTGMMRGEALSRCYAAADVFVMPSESETLGFVVLESMASGVPAVAARAGGIPNLIRDGETSILFDPGDADDMVSKINSLLNDNEKRTAMGEAARSETLRWNWRSATSVLRNVQYKIAETNFEVRRDVRRATPAPRRSASQPPPVFVAAGAAGRVDEPRAPLSEPVPLLPRRRRFGQPARSERHCARGRFGVIPVGWPRAHRDRARSRQRIPLIPCICISPLASGRARGAAAERTLRARACNVRCS